MTDETSMRITAAAAMPVEGCKMGKMSIQYTSLFYEIFFTPLPHTVRHERIIIRFLFTPRARLASPKRAPGAFDAAASGCDVLAGI